MTVLSISKPTATLSGGQYLVTTDFNNGLASLELKTHTGTRFFPLGELTSAAQTLTLPPGCTIKLLTSGESTVEITQITKIDE